MHYNAQSVLRPSATGLGDLKVGKWETKHMYRQIYYQQCLIVTRSSSECTFSFKYPHSACTPKQLLFRLLIKNILDMIVALR